MAVDSPFFFDSIFTAAAGAFFGPIAGMATGLTSHLIMEAFHGFNGMFLPFAPCNMATGLIVGLFASRKAFGSLAGAAVCTFAVTFANAVLGSFIAYFVFGGPTGHASDNLVTALLLAGGNLFTAAFWARIPTNLIDKGIAVLFAYFASKYGKRRAESISP